MEWTLGKRSDVILGQRLVAARKVIWRSFTPAEGRHWVRAALDFVDELTPPRLVARLDHAEAEGGRQFGSRLSLAAAQRALGRYRDLGDVMGVAQAQHLAGGALVSLGRPAEGELLLKEALEVARKLGNRRLAANALVGIGLARSVVGDLDGSRAHYTEALGLAKALGADSFAAPITINLASNEFRAGDAEAALRLTVDLLATHRALSSSSNLTAETVAAAISNTAAYLIALGRYDEAGVRASEALEFARASQFPVFVASIQHFAEVALRCQVEGRRTPAEYAGAARLLGFVGARNETLGFDASDAECDKALAALREASALMKSRISWPPARR
jgi:tetratricopeptide (TPR) repeat protein